MHDVHTDCQELPSGNFKVAQKAKRLAGQARNGCQDKQVQKLALELSLAMQRDGLADADVAATIGVDRSTVSRWVTGKSRISRTHHVAVAELLKVDTATAATWAASVVVTPETVTAVTTAEADELRQDIAELRRALAELQAEVRRTEPE